MELFKSFLYSHKKSILLVFLSALIFLLIFTLYHLSPRALVYPGLLCLIVYVCVLLSDYNRLRKKHKRLMMIQNQKAETISFEKPESPLEADYQYVAKELIRENKELVERYEMREQEMLDYFSVWAHQIKTPITSIQLTLENEDSNTSRVLLSNLLKIEHYVEMVLAFLRLESVESDYVFREQELEPIVKQSIAKFATDFINRSISLNLEPIHMRLVTDDKWLAFVIEQVLSNALKYTYQGSIEIFLEGDILMIRDSGIGIAPEDLPRVFDKGYTGYNGRLEKNASGLGLYLCKRVSENLGIDIEISSQLGVGTTVALDLKQKKLQFE